MKMKTMIKLALGGSVLLASVAANAANQLAPVASTTSVGNGNLLFYVVDNTAHSSYTADLIGQSVQGGNILENGVSVNTGASYFSTAQAQSSSLQGVVNTINGDKNFSYSFAGDTSLQSFISGANTAGDSLSWGVIAEGYQTTTRTVQGDTLVITTGAAGSVTGVAVNAITGTVNTKLGTDYGTLNTEYNTAGVKDTFAAAPGVSQGVFGTSKSSGGSALTLYGSNLATGQAIGSTAVELYGLTGNGGTSGTAVAFGLGSISFDGTTLSFTGNTPTVPIPGAVWLFGSGVLGLLGIGRRRERTGAVAA